MSDHVSVVDNVTGLEAYVKGNPVGLTSFLVGLEPANAPLFLVGLKPTLVPQVSTAD